MYSVGYGRVEDLMSALCTLYNSFYQESIGAGPRNFGESPIPLRGRLDDKN